MESESAPRTFPPTHSSPALLKDTDISHLAKKSTVLSCALLHYFVGTVQYCTVQCSAPVQVELVHRCLLLSSLSPSFLFLSRVYRTPGTSLIFAILLSGLGCVLFHSLLFLCGGCAHRLRKMDTAPSTASSSSATSLPANFRKIRCHFCSTTQEHSLGFETPVTMTHSLLGKRLCLQVSKVFEVCKL